MLQIYSEIGTHSEIHGTMEEALTQLVQTQTQQTQSLKALQDAMTVLGRLVEA